MGRWRIALALISFVFAASLTAEAITTHESFSARSYYETDDKSGVPSKDPTTETTEKTETTEDPNNRYPDGYPGQDHHYNPVTKKYDDQGLSKTTSETTNLPTEKTTETTEDPNNRYPDGYPGQDHHYNPVTKKYDDQGLSKTTSETTNLPTEKTTETTEDPNNRYPDGYPGQDHHYNPVTKKYDDQGLSKTTSETTNLPTEKSTETTEDPNNRYPDGYPGQDHHYNPVTKKYDDQGHGPFNQQQQYLTGNQPDNLPDEYTFDRKEGRYKLGYFPKSSYAGAAYKTTATTNGGVSLTAQTNTLQGDFSNRYEQGYYPTLSYTQHGSMYQKPTTYSSYTGQFSTMPYPSSGVPFVASGAGCSSPYWVENIDMWPRFLTVKSTVGDALGKQAAATYGQTTILQGLMKYGNDPYNELLKATCAALLNSVTRGAYRLSYMKVIDQFNAALVSPEAAKAQADLFEADNMESIASGTACK